MGVERDYLMRQLMMLLEVIQRIFRMRKKGDKEEALKEVKYFYNILKVEGNFQVLSMNEILEILEKKKFTNEQIEMIAFVLKEQGELESEENKRLDFFKKSYFLLEKVERESTSFSMDRQMKLGELREYLN